MADEFDAFLGAALAPAEREADRAFVTEVQARIALDAHLEAERSLLFWALAKQIAALLAIAAAAAWLPRSATVAHFLTSHSGAGLLILLVAFGLITLLLMASGRPEQRSQS